MADDALTEGSRSYIEQLLSGQMTRRQLFIATGGLTLAGALAACTSTNTTRSVSVPKVSRYSTLNVGIEDLSTQDPDPMAAYSHGGIRTAIWSSLGEPLVRRNLQGALTPALATSWTISPDGLTWTFHLREGVQMQDGTPFTSQDVQTAITRVKNYPGVFSLNEPAVNAMTAVNLIDANTIAITTSAPYVSMLDDLPIPIPTAYYHSVGDAHYGNFPLAAGPFKFVSQSLNQSMTFERFDAFWDPTRKPNFKTLNLVLLPEESTRIAGLQSGSLDVAHDLSQNGVQQLTGQNGINIITGKNTAGANIYLAALNPMSPTLPKAASPVHDVRVRLAMLYALDLKAMASSVFRGEAEPWNFLGTPLTLGANPANTPRPYDPAKARQLLQQAGHPSFDFELVSKNADNDIPNVQSFGEAIVAYWQAVGINATYAPMEPTLQAELQDSHVFTGAFMIGLEALKMQDPSYQANEFMLPTAGNVSVDDPKLFAFANQLNTTIDPTARLKVARDYNDYLYQTEPCFTLMLLNSFSAIGPHVSEWLLQAGNGECGPFWNLRGA
jgi:peptide/nickel transport system substrate-binding protein